MQSHLRVERRANQRAEQEPVEQSAAEQNHDKVRRQEITNEVAELEATSDEMIDAIDKVLALNIGYVSVSAA